MARTTLKGKIMILSMVHNAKKKKVLMWVSVLCNKAKLILII